MPYSVSRLCIKNMLSTVFLSTSVNQELKIECAQMANFMLAHLAQWKTKLMFTFWINYKQKVSNVAISEKSHFTRRSCHCSFIQFHLEFRTKVKQKNSLLMVAKSLVYTSDLPLHLYAQWTWVFLDYCAVLVPTVEWWMQNLLWCNSGHWSSVFILAWMSGSVMKQ